MLQKFAGQDEVLASDIETLIKANPRQDGDYVRVGKLKEPLKSRNCASQSEKKIRTPLSQSN